MPVDEMCAAAAVRDAALFWPRPPMAMMSTVLKLDLALREQTELFVRCSSKGPRGVGVCGRGSRGNEGDEHDEYDHDAYRPCLAFEPLGLLG